MKNYTYIGALLRAAVVGVTLLHGCPAAVSQTSLIDVCGIGFVDEFGFSVAAVGDLDGDGQPDWIAGATFADLPVQIGLGSVRIFSATTEVGTVFGDTVAAEFSYALSAVGDLDGDGRDDFLVSEPSYALPGQSSRGRVLAFSGADQSIIHELVGYQNSDSLGFSLAGIGDITGDGTPDFIAGAPGGVFLPGRVSVFDGASGQVIYDITGTVAAGNFGISVCGVGDNDGDGVPDFAVGAFGEVSVFSGDTGDPIRVLTGNTTVFGHAITGVDDTTGDGIEEILVSDPRDSSAGLNAGSVWLFSGSDGSVLNVLYGEEPSDEFGWRLDTGDITGDGVADLLISSMRRMNFAGEVYAYEADGTLIFSIPGEDPLGRFGSGVAVLDDVTGDGLPEIVVGSHRGMDAQGTVTGSVHVFSYPYVDPTAYCRAPPNSTGVPCTISAAGSASVTTNLFGLSAQNALPNEFGLFYYGDLQIQTSFGDGFRCVSGTAGVFRLLPPVMSDAGGNVQKPVDLSAAAGTPGEFLQGSAWNFQFWYRDPLQPGGAGFNLSNAIEVCFCF